MDINDLQAVKAHQKEFLGKLKAKKEPYIATIEGIDLVVHPGVFPPVTDSELFARNIKVNPGESVLDLTTGCGVFAVIAGLQGATGLAVDLNPLAVINANENFKKFEVEFKAIHSDLFENVPTEKFDYIYANGPYTEGEITEPLQLAFFGARSFLTRLFSRGPLYLKPDGAILITVAEWGELKFFENAAIQNGFLLELIDKKTSDSGRVYRFYRTRLKL